MTDMDIPQAAVEAVYEARGDHRDASGPTGTRCSCGQAFPTGVKQLEHETRALLGAALPHLQADTKADQICGDIACPGLANCKDPDCSLAKAKPFMEGASELGRRLGRQEAAEEIAVALDDTAASLHKTAEGTRQQAIDEGRRSTYHGDRLMRMAIGQRNRAEGLRSGAVVAREYGANPS